MSMWTDVTNLFTGNTPTYNVPMPTPLTATTIDATDLLNQMSANFNTNAQNVSGYIAAGMNSAPSNNPLASQMVMGNTISDTYSKMSQNYANQYAQTAYDAQRYNATATNETNQFNSKQTLEAEMFNEEQDQQAYEASEANLSGLLRTAGTVGAMALFPPAGAAMALGSLSGSSMSSGYGNNGYGDLPSRYYSAFENSSCEVANDGTQNKLVLGGVPSKNGKGFVTSSPGTANDGTPNKDVQVPIQNSDGSVVGGSDTPVDWTSGGTPDRFNSFDMGSYLSNPVGGYLQNAADNSAVYTYAEGGPGQTQNPEMNDPSKLKSGPLTNNLQNNPDDPLGSSMVTQDATGNPAIDVAAMSANNYAGLGYLYNQNLNLQKQIDALGKQITNTPMTGNLMQNAQQSAQFQQKAGILEQKQAAVQGAAMGMGYEQQAQRQQATYDAAQQAVARQQVALQQLQQNFPTMSYASIQSNMGATNRVLEAISMLFGGVGAAYLGKDNPATDYIYKSMDSLLNENNIAYQRAVQNNQMQFGNTMKGLDMNLQSSDDAMKMLHWSAQDMSQAFANGMKGVTDAATARNAMTSAATAMNAINKQLFDMQVQRNDLLDKKQTKLTQIFSGSNIVNIPMFDANGNPVDSSGQPLQRMTDMKTRQQVYSGKQGYQQVMAQGPEAFKNVSAGVQQISGQMQQLDQALQNIQNVTANKNMSLTDYNLLNNQLDQLAPILGDVKSFKPSITNTAAGTGGTVAGTYNSKDVIGAIKAAKARLKTQLDALQTTSTMSPERTQQYLNQSLNLINSERL